jgi:ketosteroid isomerase-like protein
MSRGPSTSSHLTTLVRSCVEASARRDLDAMMSFYAADAVLDTSLVGWGTFRGRQAIRGFYGDWLAAYEDADYEVEVEEFATLAIA